MSGGNYLVELIEPRLLNFAQIMDFPPASRLNPFLLSPAEHFASRHFAEVTIEGSVTL